MDILFVDIYMIEKIVIHEIMIALIMLRCQPDILIQVECSNLREIKISRLIHLNKLFVHVPDGVGFEAGEAGKAYEELMAKTGQVEIQLLGLGCNGHIGFNEPADEFTKVTGEIDLTDSTIEANKRFFEKKEDVPRKAVSMGIGTIMRAKKIVLLVNGENKAEILKEVVNGPVTPKVPGSILQFHPHVTVICDEEAAKYL